MLQTNDNCLPFDSALAPPELGGVRVGHLFSFLRGVVFLGLFFFCVLCHVRPMFPETYPMAIYNERNHIA